MIAPVASSWSSVLMAFAIGLAVASAPGPVQAIVVAESIRGGVTRGLAVTAGAAISFGLLLVLLVFGLSVASPSGDMIRALQGIGGVVLLWFAVDGYRSATAATVADRTAGASVGGRLPAPVRVGIAVLVFPGTWIFVAGIASPLISAARASAGFAIALAVALSLVGGTAIGNVVISVLGGWGRNIASAGTVIWIRKGLAVVLGLIGLAMLASALLGIGS